MRIKKIVYFDKPGERAKLEKIKEECSSVNSFALAIDKNFEEVDFSQAISIAEIWFNLKSKK